jgi:TldD protein
MIFTQKQLHDRLASLPGTCKELYIENHTGVGIRVVNGRSEPVSLGETSGISLLLTNGSHRYFQTRESLESFDELMDQAKAFEAETGEVTWAPGTDSYDFDDTKGLLETLSELHERVLPQVDSLRSHDWITSTMVGMGISEQSYVSLSDRQPGGMDRQYQVRVFAMATGKIGEVTQEYYDSITANHSLEYFTAEHIAAMFKKIAERLHALLLAPAAPCGEMDIVIATEAGGVIIHEAVGHGLEGDLQASSAYANKVGEMVASPKVTIVDDPLLPGLRGSYRLDHEGTPSARAVLIENGKLLNYMQQQGTADFLGLPHNGHARRESYAHESIVRMSNTYMDNGPDSPADIVASVKDGLYITALGGGQVNTTSGDFVFKVNFAQRIKDGQIGEVVRGANLSGNGPKMLKEISMVGNDLVVGKNGVFIGGTCGKDGQGMPVTDANPTIKVRLKVTA